MDDLVYSTESSGRGLVPASYLAHETKLQVEPIVWF
jgi:hypothetical protein